MMTQSFVLVGLGGGGTHADLASPNLAGPNGTISGVRSTSAPALDLPQ